MLRCFPRFQVATTCFSCSPPDLNLLITNFTMRWAGHVARMSEKRGSYRVLVGKPEEKRPLGRPRRRWVDNNRMDLQEVGGGYVDWIDKIEKNEMGWACSAYG